MLPNRFAALRYMDGFGCIGSECEDNCCHSWSVYVDQSTHQRLKKAMARNPDDAARFERSLQMLPPAERNRDSFAQITDAATGNCPMLDGQGLCIVHGRYGEALLPSVCATFPRQVMVVGGRAELTASLSCPEVARRALLQPGATDLIEVDPQLFGQPRRQRSLDPDEAPPYEAELDDIRGTLYQLFGLGEYPISSRLYFAVSLAERVSDFFHAEAEELDEPRLADEIRSVETPSVRDLLHDRFRALPTDGPLAISVLAQALAARLLIDRVPRINRLVDAVFTEYAKGGGARSNGEGAWTLSPEPLWASYHERRERLASGHAARVEGWFQNFAQHQVFHEWYCDLPTLLVYLQTVALKMALVRFLVVGHPLATEALTQPQAEAGALLDRAVVGVSYSLARSFDHAPHFLEAMTRTMAEMLGPTATVALLKL